MMAASGTETPRITARRRARRDQPRRLEVGLLLVLVLADSSGRLLGPTPPDFSRAGERLQEWWDERTAGMERALVRMRRGGTPAETRQPEFAGTWRTSKSVDLDDFLDRAMGVGYLKRSIAVKASQTQKLYQRGDIVHLEISDRRGTARYTLRPDGKVHTGSGFQKLPIKQRAKWGRDGSLMVEERYAVHLGGEEHGEKCSGDSCPLIRSRRSVDKASGQMLMELERTLPGGDVVKTRTYYKPHTSGG